MDLGRRPHRYGRPPLLGEHTREVLDGLGLPAQQIDVIEAIAKSMRRVG